MEIDSEAQNQPQLSPEEQQAAYMQQQEMM